MVVLKGITWDHDRGYLPLLRTTESFERLHPDIKIVWKRRSLKEFGDYPVEKLVGEYDLLLIDHPFVGEAWKLGILADFNRFLSPGEMQIRREQELGQSFRCYCYKGRQLALSVDIAAMVSAVREDLLAESGVKPPGSFEEILKMAGDSGRVAVPLTGTDIWDIFLSLGAAKGGREFVSERGFMRDEALWSLEQVLRLAEAVPEKCLDLNPIQIMDAMAAGEEIFYAPFCFGYVNYAWKDRRHPLHFCDTPLWEGAETAPILGGVGIAVSAESLNVREAVQYAEYVTRPEIQAGEYFLAGGQPGQMGAWMSEKNNELTGGFFRGTADTIRRAYVRPRFPGWNRLQEAGGHMINAGVKGRERPEKTLAALEKLFFRLFGDQ